MSCTCLAIPHVVAVVPVGLLEDVSLHGQLFISRIFDKLRWLLGKLTFSSVGQTPTAAAAPARQHFSSCSQAGGGSAKAESGGLFGMLRSPRHPASRAAVRPGAAGVTSFGVGFAAGRRWKLRSVTSVDLPVRSERSDRGPAAAWHVLGLSLLLPSLCYT